MSKQGMLTGAILNSKIYVRTKYAWYILDTPSDKYRPFFIPFWIKHRILHLVVSLSLKNLRITYDTFIELLSKPSEADDDNLIALKFIRRALNKNDVESPDVVSSDACQLGRDPIQV